MSEGGHGGSDLVGGRVSGGGSSRAERAAASVYECSGPLGLLGVSAASRSLQGALGFYVDPVTTERVVTECQQLSGEAADVTIMFVDTVGFTGLAKDAIPEEVVSDLYDCFDLGWPVIACHGGHTNKRLGDGLMAGVRCPGSARRSRRPRTLAAQDIDLRLAERCEGKLRARIGLNSGTVVVGSMGGGRKLDYTVIGDAVNVAARVEALTRQTGDSILLTETTRQALSDPTINLDARGSPLVTGRKNQIAIYTLPNGRSSNPDPIHWTPLGSKPSYARRRWPGMSRTSPEHQRHSTFGGSRLGQRRGGWRASDEYLA